MNRVDAIKKRVGISGRILTTVDAMHITPDDAKWFLGEHVRSGGRNFRDLLSEDKIASMSATIDDGGWGLVSDAIVIRPDGSIANGQNRLEACSRGTVGIDAFVFVGDIHEPGQDRGVKRNLGQLLQSRGEPDSKNLAATLRVYALLFDGDKPQPRFLDMGSGYAVNEKELLLLLDREPTIRASVAMFRSKHTICYPTIVSAIHYRGLKIDKEHTSWWARAMLTGADLSETDPVYRFRSMFGPRHSGIRRSHSRSEIAALCVKSWRLSREGASVRSLMWRNSGPAIESFPSMA